MATALSQLQQHQHHHSQQLDFNLPVSSAGGVASSPVRSCSPTPSPVENFCKECGLAFESHTSLEVHLSYHRANLLTRWAAQDPHNSTPTAPTTSASSMDSKFQPKTNTIQPSPVPPPQGPLHMSPVYFDQHGGEHGGGHAQYNTLPPDYHNSNGGGDQFPPSHRHHHHIFPQDAPPPQQHYDSRHSRNDPGPREKEQRPGGGSEEILDLDSNKVHIYNMPPQQQLQYLHANNFYRPYLMTQPLPSPTNGNHHPPPGQLQPPFPPPPFPQDAQHLNHHIYKSNPSPPQRSPMNQYEFTHGQHQYPPPPPGDHGSNPATYHQAPPTFRGNFPPQKFPREVNSPEPNLNSLNLIPSGVEGGKKGKKTKVGHAPPPPLNGEDSNSPAPPKTKGWKGGECKRPKTYNCTACNKWFTSSGHLKRHYGTTLHKNSLRQRGENPDEQPPAASGKKKKEMQLKRRSSGEEGNGSGGDSNNGIIDSSSRSHHPNALPNVIKSEDSNNATRKSSVADCPPLSSGGRGPLPDFSHQGHHHAAAPSPTTPSYPSNPPTYLHVYHNGPQGPPPQPPYGAMPMGMSPHAPQFHPSFGYDAGSGLMTSSPNVYAVSVPTSMYGGGYPTTLMSSDIPGSQLPPFGTVLSPYDQQFGHHGITMSSNGPVYIHQGGPPGSPPYDSESGIHSNSTSDGIEHLKNGESPEAVRSASSASGLVSSDDAEMMSEDGDVGSGSTGFSSGNESSDPSLSLTPKPPTLTTEGGSQLLKCSDCSKTFNRTCYLTQHTNSSHSGGKPFKCPTCGKRFPEAPALSDHVAKHGDNKPYKCELCPKQFNHKTDLRRHLCLHTGEKPFVCTVCGKGFIRKDHMTKHSETHRKVKSTTILGL